MLSEKNINELNLSEEQLMKYKELLHKENILRSALIRCGVHPTAVEKITRSSDLKRVDPNNIEALEEDIRQTWSDLIIKKENKK